MKLIPNVIDSPVSTGRKHYPAFDLFVRLKDDRRGPGGGYIYETEWSKRTGKREWCFNGDKFTTDPLKQLQNLINLANRMHAQCSVLVIRDVRKQNAEGSNQEDYTVLKVVRGRVEINKIEDYKIR